MPVGTVGPGGLELPQQLLDAPAGPAGGGGNDQDDCLAYLCIYDVRLKKREGLKIGNRAEPALICNLPLHWMHYFKYQLDFWSDFTN